MSEKPNAVDDDDDDCGGGRGCHGGDGGTDNGFGEDCFDGEDHGGKNWKTEMRN